MSTIFLPDNLRSSLKSEVIVPGDSAYEDARRIFSGNIDRKPAAIVQVQNTDDVARVILFAKEHNMELAVRSGGHSTAGHSTTDGGIVLDLSLLKAMDIDISSKTAWAQTGLTADEYTKKASAYGLVTGFGDTGSVGIGGITLGGGIGYLVRKYGLTIDDVLAADIVTANGETLYTDPQMHPDLFWAIRGGGGNFGVVTRFRYRLHELKAVLGGMLILPATPDTIASFISEAEAAPDDLSTIANIMTAPPLPFIPSLYHGKPVIMATLTFAGDIASGERVIAPFRNIAPPLTDIIRPMSYAEVYPEDQKGYHPITASYTMFLDSVSPVSAGTIIDYISRSKASMAVIQLRVLGGAMARIPPDATAFAHRKSRIMANIAAVYERPDDHDVHETWVAAFADAIRQTDTGAYVNFLGSEGQARIHAAYPNTTWERLQTIKTRYDPTNLFRLNQNILPLT